MAMLKLWISLLLVGTVVLAQKQQCNRNTMDITGARVTTFNERHGRKFPENREQMTEYCKGTKEDVQWLQNYNQKCQKGSTKQFTSVLIFPFKSIVRNFCSKKNKKRTTELLNMAGCANKHRGIINKCLTSFIEKEQGIMHAQKDKRIPHLCCEYYKFLNCINQDLKPKCPKQTEPILDFLRNLFQSPVDAICGDYTESTDKCDKYPAPPAKPASEKTAESFVLPLLSIWESLEEDKQ